MRPRTIFPGLLLLSLIPCSALHAQPGATSTGGLDVAPTDVFERDNLVAWCIVPFDAQARGPAERAEMLAQLGIKRLAYDWREQHVELFEQEILELKKRDIEFFAFWDQHEAIFNLCIKHDIHPQFWITVPSPDANNQQERVAMAGRSLQPLVERAKSLECEVGLYNHGGWGGEPANMIQVCAWLREQCETESVGLVYNLHHGHGHVDDFKESLDEMQPFLLCLNLNGMNRDALQKILPIGQGELDDFMLTTILQSGYAGPIGILDHRSDLDARESLRQNLEGLQAWRERQDQ
ncbi:MAG: hypothetical protein ACR2NP_18565 [Pirellulaceae bacterium]